jgi:hypothetical protein
VLVIHIENILRLELDGGRGLIKNLRIYEIKKLLKTIIGSLLIKGITIEENSMNMTQHKLNTGIIL